MADISVLHLTDRAVVKLSGADATALLQRLITTDLDDLVEGEAHYGALLTPQGKIILDFLLSPDKGGYRFDLAQSVAEDFVKKMKLYRMRSDVLIEQSDEAVGVCFEAGDQTDLVCVRDARAERLGWRYYGAAETWQTDIGRHDDYLSRHIDACIPQAGIDFAFGDAFPHDVNMDFLGGLDFAKGCYVGQEVISRMEHRGTARRRLVGISSDQPLPETGAPVVAGGKPAGTLGARLGAKGLAILRLDRVADAIAEGDDILVGGVTGHVVIPTYADFSI